MSQSEFRLRPARLCAVVALLGCASAFSAQPGATGIDASGSYQSEMAACRNGQTQQDQTTCMIEARNAHAAKKRGRIGDTSSDQLALNAMARCNVLRGDDKAACQLRMQGQGSTSGSVAGGGVLREITTEVPAESAMAPSTTITPITPIAPIAPMPAPAPQATVR